MLALKFLTPTAHSLGAPTFHCSYSHRKLVIASCCGLSGVSLSPLRAFILHILVNSPFMNLCLHCPSEHPIHCFPDSDWKRIHMPGEQHTLREIHALTLVAVSSLMEVIRMVQELKDTTVNSENELGLLTHVSTPGWGLDSFSLWGDPTLT